MFGFGFSPFNLTKGVSIILNLFLESLLLFSYQSLVIVASFSLFLSIGLTIVANAPLLLNCESYQFRSSVVRIISGESYPLIGVVHIFYFSCNSLNTKTPKIRSLRNCASEVLGTSHVEFKKQVGGLLLNGFIRESFSL